MGIISKDKREYYRKICDLTIVADHTFYKEVGGGNLDKTGVFHIITKRCRIPVAALAWVPWVPWNP